MDASSLSAAIGRRSGHRVSLPQDVLDLHSGSLYRRFVRRLLTIVLVLSLLAAGNVRASHACMDGLEGLDSAAHAGDVLSADANSDGAGDPASGEHGAGHCDTCAHGSVLGVGAILSPGTAFFDLVDAPAIGVDAPLNGPPPGRLDKPPR